MSTLNKKGTDFSVLFLILHLAYTCLPKEQRDKAKGTVAHEALERIAGIYHMYNQLAELSAEEKYRKRQLLVKLLVEALFSWLKKVRDIHVNPIAYEQ